jgi:DNA-binding LacI/PurR family transcriptional regulator
MVSINDVAKKAGVAKSTVSKVLNNYSMVSEETKRKVKAAVEELNYVPNSVAISLSKRSFHRVGLIIDIQHNRQFVDEIGMKHLTGAFDRAQVHHMDVVTFFSSQFRNMTAEQIREHLASQRISCLIIYNISKDDIHLKELVELEDFFTVLVDSSLYNQKTSTVTINHYQAQYDVASKTLHENDITDTILYIAGEMNSYVSEKRLKAMIDLQKKQGFKMIIEYGDFDEFKARQIVFQYAREVDIIVCASDLMAIGAVFALRELDVFHPVCGFDGITLMGYTQIAMNTVKQDFYKKSQLAFDEIQRLIEGGQGQYIEVPYTIGTIDYLDVIQ